MKQENRKPNARKATPIVAQDQSSRKTFDSAKRDFEKAHAAGGDYSKELQNLATAVAYTVLNKCIDPQRKTAAQRDGVTTGGMSPALVALKRSIATDVATLDNTRLAADGASHAAFTEDGYPMTVSGSTEEKRNAAALNALLDKTISDGLDLVQSAALAILEQANTWAEAGDGWMDKPFTVCRLSRRVYIRDDESAAYAEVETSPIREVFRAVRREVAASRAVQTDPRNGYLYLGELTEDGLDTIYRRLGKYADLGGRETTADPATLPGAPAGISLSGGHYTADRGGVDEYNSILERLNLTDRQAQIVRLRMQGKGYKAIATYLGVTPRCIEITVFRLRDKCRELGFTPSGMDK